MAKVYVVTEGIYDSYAIIGVYTTKALAAKGVEKRERYWREAFLGVAVRIETWQLDPVDD